MKRIKDCKEIVVKILKKDEHLLVKEFELTNEVDLFLLYKNRRVLVSFVCWFYEN
jgi:hypothetical protein